MSVLYRVNFKAATDAKIGDWFNPEGLGAAMEKVRKRSKRWKGPYIQGDWSEQKGWGAPRQDWQEACSQFADALKKNGVGDTRVMKDVPTDAKIAVRKVEIPDVDYPTISSNATPRVKAFVKPVWDEFPQLTSWGVFNCRHIAGSSSWSEHSWADAIDLHAPSMVYGDQVYRWCMSNKGRFDITRVLWRVASHYDHLHVDFDPDHSGTPPCA
jgi:hypothetical protein